MIIDNGFEDSVLACCFKSQEFSQIATQYLKIGYFSNALRSNLAKMAVDFFKMYNSTMSHTAFTHSLKKLVDKKTIKEAEMLAYVKEYSRLQALPVEDWRWVLDNLILFIKKNEWKNLIENSVKRHLPDENFDEIEKHSSRIANITTNSGVKSYDHFAPESVLERMKKREEESLIRHVGIPTGIKKMDDILHKKGWFEKELYVILAGPKMGKTMSLLYFANMATWAGYNVAYFTLEVSSEICSDRLDAQNANVQFKSLSMSSTIREVYDRLSKKTPEGKLMLFEYPTKSLTVAHAQQKIEELQMQDGVKIDFAIFDYGDIMKPRRTHKDDKWSEQGEIFEDLRQLAGVMSIPVLTASQIGRAGAGKAMNAGKDVAGSYDKIMIADQIIALSATDDERREGILRIVFSESRNNENRVLKIKTEYNLGRFYKEFVAEE